MTPNYLPERCELVSYGRPSLHRQPLVMNPQSEPSEAPEAPKKALHG